MLLGDLLTLKQLNLPVKVVVFNNNTLGFVELEMKAAGWLPYGTDLVNPDFAKLAESAGILGTRLRIPRTFSRLSRRPSRMTGRAWWTWWSTDRSFRCLRRSPRSKPWVSACT
jgi:thiamine pyrophosphate-dependent acetolactate synthase large subunit-like protein